MSVCKAETTIEELDIVAGDNYELYAADVLCTIEGEEGCLSIPDVLVPIRRAQRCTIQAQDVEGNPFELAGQDFADRRGRVVVQVFD